MTIERDPKRGEGHQPQRPAKESRLSLAGPTSADRSRPKKEAHLFADPSDPSTFEAIELLRGAGFLVSPTPASGLLEPELNLGGATYNGIKAIRKAIESHQLSTITEPLEKN